MDALYDKGRESFALKQISVSADTISAILVTSGYTPDLALHQFLSDVGANTLGAAVNLTFTSSTAGVYKATIPTIASIPAGTAKYLLIYQNTGVAGTSRLVALLDGARTVTVAAAPTGSPFSAIPVDPLPAALPAGTPITFSGASGPVTTSGVNAKGSRSLSVASSAVTGLAAGATGSADYGTGLPIVSNGVNFSVNVNPDAVNGWFKL